MGVEPLGDTSREDANQGVIGDDDEVRNWDDAAFRDRCLVGTDISRDRRTAAFGAGSRSSSTGRPSGS